MYSGHNSLTSELADNSFNDADRNFKSAEREREGEKNKNVQKQQQNKKSVTTAQQQCFQQKIVLLSD